MNTMRKLYSILFAHLTHTYGKKCGQPANTFSCFEFKRDIEACELEKLKLFGS